ncbi:MAG TPA: hypothetical protein VF337_08115 [Candidatus Limnocylindrales bacterium]
MEKKDSRGVRTYTIAALLGLFVAAVVFAIISRMMPRGLSHLVKRDPGQESEDKSGLE